MGSRQDACGSHKYKPFIYVFQSCCSNNQNDFHLLWIIKYMEAILVFDKPCLEIRSTHLSNSRAATHIIASFCIFSSLSNISACPHVFVSPNHLCNVKGHG